MDNDLPRILKALTIVALFVLLSNNVFAATGSNVAAPISLCTSREVVLFSCDIGGKKVSLCGTKVEREKPLLVQYRFGRLGARPELEYPSKATEALSAFDFGTVNNTSGFPLQTISFNIPGAAYDIMTTDQTDYTRWAPFTGVGVTIRGKTTTLLECEQGTISINLAPLKKALGLPADGRLSDTLPKYPLKKDPYPIVHEKRPCGLNCKCEIEYPKISDPAIAADIKKFTKGNCEDDFDETVKKVTATIVRDAYLTLTFSYYGYSHGAAHGSGNEETKLFRKGKDCWKPIDKEDLLNLSPMCQKRINSLLYRQLKSQLSHLDSQEDLLDTAQIAIGSQGLIFSYAQYELGSYAEGPWPVLLSYKALGSCLHLDH